MFMVTLVVTKGFGSLEIYSQNLAKRLDVPKVYVEGKFTRMFNIPTFSFQSIKNLYKEFLLYKTLKEINDALHLPNQHFGRYIKLLRKKKVIITVHDLIRFLDLRCHKPLIQKPNARDKFYLQMDYDGIKKASKIITVSNYTKKDITKFLKISEEKVDVTYLGVDHENFKPLKNCSERPIKEPYILYVGSEQPRKNLTMLFKVFHLLKKDLRFKDLKLVKVGLSSSRGDPAFRKKTLETIRELGLIRDVIFAGYVSNKDLAILYSHAECFVLLSLYEGFGLPVLEAMACGCPVIASNVTSLPEIAGNASILVNPLDAGEIVKAIKMVILDETLRKELIKKGLERVKAFSWEKCAKETLKTYKEIETSS